MVSFVPVRLPGDESAISEFLVSNQWPFHSVDRLDTAGAATIPITGESVSSFWVEDGTARVGLVRLLDLDDVDDGSPVFDLRIAESHRGRGLGHQAVRWLTSHLFAAHPGLHRIEATTRADNIAMQVVLEACGYRLEGRFVEAWRNADGTRSDALSYAILRRMHDRGC